MRRKIVAGNWKMNNNFSQSMELIDLLIKNSKKDSKCEIYVSPAYPFLKDVQIKCSSSNIKVLAQNVSHTNNGAFTGDVSCNMLKSIGVSSVIIGHSERRTFFKETDELLLNKLELCVENDFEIFYCIGENLEARKSNRAYQVIETQLNNTIFNISNINPKKLIIAYEPVWAIGTGLTAKPTEAQEMHHFIREKFKNNYNNDVSSNLTIIYGGSVKPDSAKDIFLQPDVDGGLIGGASFNSNVFSDIINSI